MNQLSTLNTDYTSTHHATLITHPHASFLQDVLNGLSQTQKTIPCKWFYDEAGSALFEEITKTQEYYPTRVEADLLKALVSELPHYIPNLAAIIEPGSGASVKTRILLDALTTLKRYVPMDISEQFLNAIAKQLANDYPSLEIQPVVGDFSHAFDTPNMTSQGSELIFFPGSTIGNFSPDEAQQLLQRFHGLSSQHDLPGQDTWLLIGVDSTQDESQLLAAYNDRAGITAAFNQNLLRRANKSLGADFVVDNFEHEARFNRTEGRVEMHLRSVKPQSVLIDQTPFTFRKDETIFTESCYKYTHATFLAMAAQAGWQRVSHWQDHTISAFTLFLLKSAPIKIAVSSS